MKRFYHCFCICIWWVNINLTVCYIDTSMMQEQSVGLMACTVSIKPTFHIPSVLFPEDWWVVFTPFCGDKRTTQIRFVQTKGIQELTSNIYGRGPGDGQELTCCIRALLVSHFGNRFSNGFIWPEWHLPFITRVESSITGLAIRSEHQIGWGPFFRLKG